MILEPSDENRDINITETSHLQTDYELSDKELKQIEADDQAIQTILLSLPKDIYAAVDIMSDASSAVTYTSVYTASEPWRYYREDSAKTGPLRVIVYRYDGLPIQPVALPSPDYVPGPSNSEAPKRLQG
nr:hypothetical protein [Tanacetum cinerariifolium]